MLVGTWRPAKAKIDTTGEQRRQCPKLLGDHQRRMVRQHDPAGTDTDRFGATGHMADAHRGRRAGDACEVVVFGEPEALEACGLSVLRQVPRIG